MKTLILDFDSTIFPAETLNEVLIEALEQDPDKNEKVQQLENYCQQAMNGETSDQESLHQRLNLARPTQEQLVHYAAENSSRLPSLWREFLLAWQASAEQQVWVISGGFHEYLDPLLAGLVPAEQIKANRFSAEFFSASTDASALPQPLDKVQVVQSLIQSGKLDPKASVMIGDGMTDLAVYKAGLVQDFFGVGCFAVRSAVKAQAPHFYEDLHQLITALERWGKENSLEGFEISVSPIGKTCISPPSLVTPRENKFSLGGGGSR